VNGGTNAITVLYEYGEWIFKVFEMSELIEVGDNNTIRIQATQIENVNIRVGS